MSLTLGKYFLLVEKTQIEIDGYIVLWSFDFKENFLVQLLCFDKEAVFDFRTWQV